MLLLISAATEKKQVEADKNNVFKSKGKIKLHTCGIRYTDKA